LQPSTIGQEVDCSYFEARGTLTELHVNGNKWGNGLVKEFAAANTTFQYQTH
jgi:hypothetical protein